MKRISVLWPRDHDSTVTASYSDAREIVEAGLGSWTNRCKAIRLTTYAKAIRGESCKPTERTIENFVNGDERAIAVIQG